MFISLTDYDLVEGTFRALLALHMENGEGSCVNCLEQSPCATVRIIAAMQDAAVARAAGMSTTTTRDGRSSSEMLMQNANRRETHRFLYPECPKFSGGICNEHKDTPLSAAT
jgi:hypothetical protein